MDSQPATFQKPRSRWDGRQVVPSDIVARHVGAPELDGNHLKKGVGDVHPDIFSWIFLCQTALVVMG